MVAGSRFLAVSAPVVVDDVLSVADDLGPDLGIATLQRIRIAAAEPYEEDLLGCEREIVLARRLEFQPGLPEFGCHFGGRVAL